MYGTDVQAAREMVSKKMCWNQYYSSTFTGRIAYILFTKAISTENPFHSYLLQNLWDFQVSNINIILTEEDSQALFKKVQPRYNSNSFLDMLSNEEGKQDIFYRERIIITYHMI